MEGFEYSPCPYEHMRLPVDARVSAGACLKLRGSVCHFIQTGSTVYEIPAALVHILGGERHALFNSYPASYWTGRCKTHIPTGVLLGYFQVLTITKKDAIYFPRVRVAYLV